MENLKQITPLFDRVGGRAGLMELLRQFYADVRQHREIGPIFNAQIQNWPEHLEKIGDFWTSATGGPPSYAGPMPQRHFPLGLKENHFEVWLDLWRRNCRIHLTPSAAGEMITLAESIGQRLRALIAMDRVRSFAGQEPVDAIVGGGAKTLARQSHVRHEGADHRAWFPQLLPELW